MCLVATHLTAKRLLVRPVGSSDRVAHTACLRGIGALDTSHLYPSFGRIPGDLPGNMREIGGTHVRIHRTRLVLHGGHREVFIGELCIRMVGKALVHGAVDLLLHMPDETLTAFTAGGGKRLRALLFQTCSQFRFAAAFLPISLLPLPQFAMKCPVVLAIRS